MEKLYLSEQAPWERKMEYYHNIELGKNVQFLTNSLNKQTKQLIATQIASSSEIIASQGRIIEGIDNLSYGMDQVAQGIQGLQATFEWGISEVVWQIEQNRGFLRNILEVLSAPLDTQAKELRKRANEAYVNGWIDDALDDFLESEKKNRYDFSIHISIGLIYLFHKIDKEKSLSYFEKAIKYAKPKSNYFTAYALLHKALILKDVGKIVEAEECTSDAISLAPDLSQAFYQNAQYNSLLNRPQKAIAMLERAIKSDINYCEKCYIEKDFEPLRNEIIILFKRLRKHEADIVNNKFTVIFREYQKHKDFILNNNLPSVLAMQIIEDQIQRIKTLIQRNSYRDYLEAKTILEDCQNNIIKVHNIIEKQLTNDINTSKDQKSQILLSLNSNITDTIEVIMKLSLVAIPISILIGLRGCYIAGPKNYEPFRDVMGALFDPILKTLIYLVVINLLLFLIRNVSHMSSNYKTRKLDKKISQENEILCQFNTDCASNSETVE